VTDLGLKELVSLQGLRELSLSWSKVADAGLNDLARLTMLQSLDLSLTSVTDAGLQSLAPLRNLQELILDDTRVTEARVKTFREAHPDCRVSLNFDFTNATKGLGAAYAMSARLDVSSALKRIEKEQKAKWEWISWVFNWKSILFAIVVAGAGGAALRNVGKPVKSTAKKTVFSVLCIGVLTVCAGAGLFLFGMLAEDQPFLRFAGTGVVFVGLLLFAVSLGRPASQ